MPHTITHQNRHRVNKTSLSLKKRRYRLLIRKPAYCLREYADKRIKYNPTSNGDPEMPPFLDSYQVATYLQGERSMSH